jgi:anti-anti-sigma factor
VEVGGEIDIESGLLLRDRLFSMIWAYGPRLALDLSGVIFLDCAGISALLGAERDARLCGGRLQLASVSACARRLISITGLQGVLAMPASGPPAQPSARTAQRTGRNGEPPAAQHRGHAA